ncbi:hypothetical protein ACP70R_015025 [Stipagrostis hirtigluma subsp. patula]
MASTSRYGAIPASPPPISAGDDGECADSSVVAVLFRRARARFSGAARRLRPWREVFDPSAFAVPGSCGEARVRARRNLAYFGAHYAVVALAFVFLDLLRHPVSMLVSLALAVAWLLLCFGRGGEPGASPPFSFCGRELDDRAVLAALGAAAVLALALTGAAVNLLLSLALAAAVTALHTASRLNMYGDLAPVVASSYLLPIAGWCSAIWVYGSHWFWGGLVLVLLEFTCFYLVSYEFYIADGLVA